MLRTITGCLALLLVAAPAVAQDMPLAQFLIDGEGWRAVGQPFPTVKHLRADAAGKVLIIHDEGMAELDATGRATPVAKASPLPAPVYPLPGPAGVFYAADSVRRLIHTERREGNEIKLDAIKVPGLACPSGLTFWPDRRTLVVGDAEGKYLWAFRIESDGSLAHGQPYYSLRLPPGKTASGITALTVDEASRVYACTPLGVQVFDPTGRLSGVLLKPAPSAPTAIAFGGPGQSTLYVAHGGQLYARKTRAKGVVFAAKPGP